MTTSFTARLNDAIEEIIRSPSMKTRRAKSRCLYTPVYRSGKYIWAKILDSDGTLLSDRLVHDGEGSTVKNKAALLLGVIFQSEDATSQTKPNPLGKAALTHVPNGIWVDTESGHRRRLDMCIVVFVLPDGATQKHQKNFKVAQRNVRNASDIMPGVVTVEVSRGSSATDISRALIDEIRPFLVGKGRPKSES